MSNIGHNAPCPCGSGKKYKRCCLGKDTAPARGLDVPAAESLLQSLEELRNFDPGSWNGNWRRSSK